MKHNYSFTGENIVLIPMDENFSESYRKLRNREDNRNFFFNSAEISSEQQAKWFRGYLEKETEFMFSIFLKDRETFIGGIGIYDIDRSAGKAEIGRIIVDRNLAGGKGYGAEAIKGITCVAENSLGMKELYAYIYATNQASIRSFLRAGFCKCDTDKNDDNISKYHYVCRSGQKG